MVSPTFHIRLRPGQRKLIEDYVSRGEYETVAEFITEAVSHHLRYVEERDFRLFIQSDEGKARVKMIVETEVWKEDE
jgi:Arc/MetJ-type ribon-helix-helix transcriptional regulator